MGKLAAILDQLGKGSIDTGNAAGKIRALKGLPPKPQNTATDRLGGADDPSGPHQEDDGHELSEARSDGRITPEQYAVLYPAWQDACAGRK